MTYIPSTAELLELWEQGRSLPHPHRAVVLLEAAGEDVSQDALARMGVGERDAHLLELRACLFGSCLHGLATCPRCRQPLECSFQVTDLTAPITQRGLLEDVEISEDKDSFCVTRDGYAVKIRSLNCSDLLTIDTYHHDVRLARQALLKRCVIEASHLGQTMDVLQLPEAIIAAMEDAMEKVDPLGNVELELSCAACTHRWTQGFDVVSFLWDEIESWASRVLQEVHILAAAYGWREADILAMNPRRRQIYLHLVEA